MRVHAHPAPVPVHSVSFLTGGDTVRAMAPALGLGLPGALGRLRFLFRLWRSGDRAFVLAFCPGCGWQYGSPFGPLVQRAAVDHLAGVRGR